MSTLADLVYAHTDLGEADIDHLHALLAQWQLLADLSFADLVLFVPRAHHGGFICVAQMRPSTGPTCYQDDLVGQSARGRWAVERAWREGIIVREGEPDWTSGHPVRQEAIPVHHHGKRLAVLARDTNLSTARVPSQLELAYLQAADELVAMVAAGSFPFHSAVPGPRDQARVGDGLLRLDPRGRVVFASPNALSAWRRAGLVGNILGEDLAALAQSLAVAGVQSGPETPAYGAVGQVSQAHAPGPEPAGQRWSGQRWSGRWLTDLLAGQPGGAELEVAGAVLELQGVPLLPDGDVRGALVLVHDVTELRGRERALLGKDALIREIHHRVKNNLQTVAALLRLQARRTGESAATEALGEAVRRVTAIALVHETLSTTPEDSVGFDTVADSVAAMTADLAATGRRARIVRQGSFGVLPARVATSLALVLSELLHNAVEHAFAGAGGTIELVVSRGPAGLTMQVRDDGAGLPAGFVLEDSPRLGLQIVRTLVRSELQGHIELTPQAGGGTLARVDVPAAALSPAEQ